MKIKEKGRNYDEKDDKCVAGCLDDSNIIKVLTNIDQQVETKKENIDQHC